MRLYSITNMYMSGIHAGIQTQHSTSELFVKYTSPNSVYKIGHQVGHLYRWAEFFKTTVVLNGGMHDDLLKVLELFKAWERHAPYEVLPFAPFYEPGVNNALTSISTIMPTDAVQIMEDIRNTKKETPEYENLKIKMYDFYGKFSIPVFEALAFMPLAK